MPKYPSLPNPDGWFAVCFSTELQPGTVLSRTLLDQEVVVFRTASGELSMLDAHCPHMGAHLGHGGRVEGEAIRCPFHGFRFAPDGRCVSTPYETKIPPKCVIRRWHVCERNGVILAWWQRRGRPPSFGIPSYDLGGWLPLQTPKRPARTASTSATSPRSTSTATSTCSTSSAPTAPT